MSRWNPNIPLSERLGWLVHDVVVHPITGVALMAAKSMPSRNLSLRIAALAHHIHNATAPSNDSLADYAEAATRAGHNEREFAVSRPNAMSPSRPPKRDDAADDRSTEKASLKEAVREIVREELRALLKELLKQDGGAQ